MREVSVGQAVAERLYYDSPELRFAAVVTDIRLVAQERTETGETAQLWKIALDRTAFYPESGGQPWDTGRLIARARSGAVLEVSVERVEEDETGEVWHFVRKPLVQGTEVEGIVDADRRSDHMQQHSGQHLLSAVFLARLGARTVSFHLGEETSTIDLSLGEGVRELDWEPVLEVEEAVNRLIFADRAMTPRWHTRQEAEAMLASGSLRKLPDRSGPIRVVEMEGVELNACGGTHVASTGAIGGLQIRSMERAKQGWRVEFVCGLRAVLAARRTLALLRQTATALSVGQGDVPGRVIALQEETKGAAKLQRALLGELADARAEELLRRTATGGIVEACFGEKTIEFAKRVASVVGASGRAGVIGAVEGNEGCVAVVLPPGDSRHAGQIVREMSARFGVRGGGSQTLAQGVCGAQSLRPLVGALVEKLAGDSVLRTG
ncbi:MAG TPA: alanine--tRNA ligase-related protein [Acidobacteriaceae bacterium]|nr:alanine--tRNA ligase-related protein [Acidobacteriaceae bacterium]